MIVLHRHVRAADTAEHTALQQCGAFAHRSGRSLLAECHRVIRQPLLIGEVLIPGNVSDVALRKDELPLGQGQPLHVDPTVWLRAATTAAVDKGAGISWVAQYLKNTAVGRDRPRQITLLLTHALAARKTKAVIDHPAHRLES